MKFVIISDSCCDLPRETREVYGVEYLSMSVSYGEKSIPAKLDWEDISVKEYYDVMRSGERIKTSQINSREYIACFEEYLKNGYDVLSISCSSALSASVNASMVARDELKAKYPERNIVCIDALISGNGLGLLCKYASKLRKEGKDIIETASLVEELKNKVNQIATVSELKYLKMSGRISSSKAFFGMVFNVKPIIISNQKGENVSIEKAKGRENSILTIANKVASEYVGGEMEGVFISHGDCVSDAEKLKEYISDKLPNVPIEIAMLNPIMGASCGPGTLAAYFVGKGKPVTE